MNGGVVMCEVMGRECVTISSMNEHVVFLDQTLLYSEGCVAKQDKAELMLSLIPSAACAL